MSFSVRVKNEISKQKNSLSENISELSAIYRNSAIFDKEHIEIISENINVVQRIYKLNKDIYRVQTKIEKAQNYNLKKTGLYILTIDEKIDHILSDLSVTNEKGFYLLEPKNYIYDEDLDKRGYLRGIFLSKGSINDPKTSRYHLEFSIDTKEEADFVCRLLNDYKLNAKVLSREKTYMVYIKEAEKIALFLRLIKASKAVMYYEDIRVFRDQMNITNRLNNMEQANTNKIVRSAYNQIEDIKYYKEHIPFEVIDEKLQTVITYRLKYPESSLQELAEIISLETNSKITKSGLNHRFRKIKKEVEKLKEIKK